MVFLIQADEELGMVASLHLRLLLTFKEGGVATINIQPHIIIPDSYLS